jgi:hypothetical protein
MEEKGKIEFTKGERYIAYQAMMEVGKLLKSAAEPDL